MRASNMWCEWCPVGAMKGDGTSERDEIIQEIVGVLVCDKPEAVRENVALANQYADEIMRTRSEHRQKIVAEGDRRDKIARLRRHMDDAQVEIVHLMDVKVQCEARLSDMRVQAEREEKRLAGSARQSYVAKKDQTIKQVEIEIESTMQGIVRAQAVLDASKAGLKELGESVADLDVSKAIEAANG